MTNRRRRLKPWTFFPLAIICVAVATIIFVFAFKNNTLQEVQSTAATTPAPEATPEATPTPALAPIRLFAYKENGLWGYKSEAGVPVILPAYTKAQEFSENLAWVMDGANLYGLINEKGELIYPNQYEDVRSFIEGYAAVKKDGKWGYVNNTGAMQLMNEYDAAWDFASGYARVSKDGKFYYIDQTGALPSDQKYDAGTDFATTDLGVLAVTGLKDAESEKYYYYVTTPNGQKNAALGNNEAKEPFSENLVIIRLSNGTYTYYDTSGQEFFQNADATVTGFESALNFQNELAGVKRDGSWGFIKKETPVTYAITTQYKEVQSFSEGYAAVRDDGGWFYIDTTGQVIGSNPSDRYSTAEPFKNGYAKVLIVNTYWILDVSGNRVELYSVDPSELLQTYTAEVRTNSSALNIRSAPDIENSTVISQVPTGTHVTVIETTGDWAKIEYENVTGYIAVDYLFKVEDAEQPAEVSPAATDTASESDASTSDSSSNIITSID